MELRPLMSTSSATEYNILFDFTMHTTRRKANARDIVSNTNTHSLIASRLIHPSCVLMLFSLDMYNKKRFVNILAYRCTSLYHTYNTPCESYCGYVFRMVNKQHTLRALAGTES